MKTSNHSAVRMAIVLVAGVLAGAVPSSAEPDTVQSPTLRHQSIARAKAFLAAKEMPALTTDPFHPDAFALLTSGGAKPPPNPTNPAEPPAGPRTDRDLIQSIAASLKPSGYFVIGGKPTLVFGQKRVNSGSLLTILFEGTEYTLEIVSVDRTNFTLRLNREEFTRPIK
jgi:hypothetical protein